MSRWILLETDADIELMAATLNIPLAMARAMANRGVRSKHAALKYLKPERAPLCHVAQMADAERAADTILQAITDGRKIAVYGDYDVDGVMSTVILVKTLTALGADGCFMIPERERDGYGLNLSRAAEMKDMGVTLVVTCDNGITAHKEIDWLSANGAGAVVIDHHEPPVPEGAPNALAVVNPKRADCAYPYKQMCAAGLCYRFAAYLHERAGRAFAGADEALALAAIATFCDVVDLTGENRTLAKAGLDVINAGRHGNEGLSRLMDIRGLTGKQLTAFDVGFVIGPCINAAGRMARAEEAVALFLSQTTEEAAPLAERLAYLNERRKQATEDVSAQAAALADRYPEDRILVLHAPDACESVAGIAAGRIRERANKPVVMLTGRGMVKGSARSVEGCNIFAALTACKELFDHFGGHPMAAGLTMPEANVAALRERLNADCTLTEEDLTRKIYIDGELALADVTQTLATGLSLMEPFGKANHAPVFCTRGVNVERADVIGRGKTTLRLALADGKGRRVGAVYFGGAERLAELAPQIDVAYTVELNHFRGETTVQLRIVDIVP